MDGMPIVLIAIVVAAGLFAVVTLVLDMTERRNYQRALRNLSVDDAPAAGEGGKGYAKSEHAGSAR